MTQETTGKKKQAGKDSTYKEEVKIDRADTGPQEEAKENTSGSSGTTGSSYHPGTQEEKDRSVLEEFGESVGKFATKTYESIKKSIDQAMDSRNTVLSIRITEEANEKMRMLVETGLFKSRSECAAFLIEEGIKHQSVLFDKIGQKMGEINKLRDDIKEIVSSEMKKEVYF